MNIEFTDRYQTLGIPYPDPETVCRGQCEGTGMVPIHANEGEELYRMLWREKHAEGCTTRGILAGLLRAKSTTPTGTLKYVWWLLRRLVTPWSRCDDGWHFVWCPDCGGSGKIE
ncbi:hypothetical protein LCGC14_1346200 [marine sediment metagenome]|uniref:Uncharacterized protein n=1 Tax=marine sediment metagenome TaxID=412755 RepID=A0A0F9KCA3_9ZZZZ